MQLMSAWRYLIYAGCFAATLSTALTNLLSVPRLIQALGIDKIYPGLIFFSKGYGKHGEPYRGYVLTFLVSAAFVIIGEKLYSNYIEGSGCNPCAHFTSPIERDCSPYLQFLLGILRSDQLLYIPRCPYQTVGMETNVQGRLGCLRLIYAEEIED